MHNMKKSILLLPLLAVLFTGAGAKPASDPVIHPMPAGESVSKGFGLRVAGRDVPVYIARVAPLEKKLRFKAMDDKVNSGLYYDQAAFASFDTGREVAVEVDPRRPVESFRILPSSAGVKATVSKGKITFKVKPGQQLTVEVNGDVIRSLHIFANSPETDRPDPADPNVVYYGPGIHTVSRLVLRDNQTLYLAGGAILRTIVSDEEKQGADPVTGLKPGGYHPSISLVGKNIRVCGRGIIDASLCPTHARNMILAQGSDITIEGIILRDASLWTVPVRMSERVRIDNLKLIGYRANSDGIDICNSRGVTVENCFIRTLDDLVVVKTLVGKGTCRDITVRRCVLWNEVAHALSVGAEIREDISGVLFEDCDVIHDLGREWALRVYHCDAARVSDIRFENIRVEECRELISLWINKAVWSADSLRGHIDNVTFRNITATGSPATVSLKGYGPSNLIRGVAFEGVTINGAPLTEAEVARNEYVGEITVKP